MPEHDVLVVGGGFAGMRAAIAAKTAGANVGLASKVYPLRSQSSGVHSGINAALGAADSWQSHALDTVRAGGFLADQDLVEILCQEGIQDVIQLEHLGVVFSRNDQGRIDVMPFSGSSSPRTCYAGDSVGHIILQVLYEQLLRRQVQTYDEWFVTSLLVEDGSCRGVIAQQMSSGELQTVHAKTVVLATGGLGRMYQPSTSAFTSTADGAALAYRAGVPLQDMEMVQYHPTTLKGRGVVITEAARGEGAYLVNSAGDRFMGSYSSKAMELATRELCCQAIEKEIAEGRGQDGCVFLDFRHLSKERVEDRLPETKLVVKNLSGIDIGNDLVPVRPAMHRPIGGIQVDGRGSTSLPGLYATGENACSGVNGANRLGGNSLLECIVFGRRTGEAAAQYAQANSLDIPSASLLAEEQARLRDLVHRTSGQDNLGSLRRELALTMHQKVGLNRNEQGLREAEATINDLSERYERVGVADPGGSYNPTIATFMELGYMLEVAQVIIASSLARQESRGAHQRSDFPNTDDANWSRHTLASKTADGPRLEYKPVVITQWQPDR